jgi:hypothetical protein
MKSQTTVNAVGECGADVLVRTDQVGGLRLDQVKYAVPIRRLPMPIKRAYVCDGNAGHGSLGRRFGAS